MEHKGSRPAILVAREEHLVAAVDRVPHGVPTCGFGTALFEPADSRSAVITANMQYAAACFARIRGSPQTRSQTGLNIALCCLGLVRNFVILFAEKLILVIALLTRPCEFVGDPPASPARLR